MVEIWFRKCMLAFFKAQSSNNKSRESEVRERTSNKGNNAEKKRVNVDKSKQTVLLTFQY